MIGELMKSLGLASIVIFGALFVSFRSLRFGLASVLPNLFPIVTAASALVVFDHPLLLSGSIVFSICLGIAVDDTIHVIHRYRRERASGTEPVEAARRTLRTIASALLVSTAVLLGGFSVMAASSIPVLRTLGYLSVVALIAAFIGDVVLLPALLVASRRRRPQAPV